MRKERKPAKWIETILEILLKERFADEVIGDLYEWYEIKQGTLNLFKFYFFYISTIFKTLRIYKLKNLRSLFLTLTELIMISNNLKIGIRSLINQRFFSIINIVGLTISLISFIFIYAYVNFELSYDTYHQNGDHIYKVLGQNKQDGSLIRPTPTPLAKTFKTSFPGAIEFARLGQDPVIIDVNGEKFYEEQFHWGDASLFTMFDMPFKYGDHKNALKEPNTIVLTHEIAIKYFGAEVDPVGKSLPVKIYDGNVEMSMRIDGVLEPFPENTNINFEVVGSIENALELYSQFEDSWGFLWLHTYAHIPIENDFDRINQELPTLLKQLEEKGFSPNQSFYFQPLRDVHLHSANISGANVSGNINHVRTFIAIGFFIILIAIVNYLNLVGARVNKRRLEVNVRKVLGANKGQLLAQYLTESNLTVFISFTLASLACLALWPYFIGFLDKKIPFEIIYNLKSIAFITLVILVAGTLSGIYPAFVLSALKVGNGFNLQQKSHKRNWLLKGMVSFQFVVTVFLVLSTMVIFLQINFMTNKDLGFNEEQLISIKVEDRGLQTKIELIKEEMRKSSGVRAITTSSESLPSAMNNTWDLNWKIGGENKRSGIHIVSVDKEYFATLEIPILKGGNFIKSYESDSSSSILINEVTASLLNKDDPVGMKVTIGGKVRTIIGVVKDYHYRSLKDKVQPIAFMITGTNSRLNKDNLIAKIDPSIFMQSISSLDQIWQKFTKKDFFSFQIVNKSFEEIYQSEQKFLQLFSIFSALSIIISCLGLYGVVLFATEEKSKEISIRKVLGSSTLQIMLLVSKSFLLLVILGFVLGVPLAIYFSQDWLSQFEYRINIGLSSVIISGTFVLMIAILTVGIRTFKAATANPSEYLRNE